MSTVWKFLCAALSFILIFMVLGDRPTKMPTPEEAIKGREQSVMDKVSDVHAFNGHSTKLPFPKEMEIAMFGMGCFWGAERKFWQTDGVYSTQVGYAAGYTENPTYEEVCTGLTGHNEVVRVVFDPAVVTYEDLLHVFWENHDPTQGMRQYGDQGTQYRSGIYFYTEQQEKLAFATRQVMQQALRSKGYSAITTEILTTPTFYYAEDYHQQYLHKNPDGYCGLKGTGVTCPRGLGQKLKLFDEL